jgi:hypothetical protein
LIVTLGYDTRKLLRHFSHETIRLWVTFIKTVLRISTNKKIEVQKEKIRR